MLFTEDEEPPSNEVTSIIANGGENGVVAVHIIPGEKDDIETSEDSVCQNISSSSYTETRTEAEVSRDVPSDMSRDLLCDDQSLSSIPNNTKSHSLGSRSSTLSPRTSSDSQTLSSRTPSRSSFKSYVRGSNLWGMAEDGTGRSASFKSYRTEKLDVPSTEIEDMVSNTDEKEETSAVRVRSSPVLSGSRPVSRVEVSDVCISVPDADDSVMSASVPTNNISWLYF